MPNIQSDNLFNEYHDYITSCAAIRAREVVERTGRTDFDDYQQDILLYIWRMLNRFDPNRAKPKTYINLLAVSARGMVIRKLYRKKNLIISQAQELPDYERWEEDSHE